MRFGVHLPNMGSLVGARAVAETARRAEALGYHALWVNDHLVWERELAAGHVVVGSMNAAPKADHLESLVTLSFAAALTRRIRLGTAVLTVPLRDPLLLAKQTATLDVLSGGRVILGVGAGGVEEEFATLALPFQGRGRLVDRGVRQMRQLWETATLQRDQGRPVHAENFLPRPVQQPGPPIWVGGNSEYSLKRVATIGDGWLPWSLTVAEYAERVPRLAEMAAAAGRPCPTVAAQHLVVLDDGDGKALGRARATLEHRYGDWANACERAIAGPPADIQERLVSYAAAGVEEVVLGFVSDSPEALLDDLVRFAEDVIAPLTHRADSRPVRRATDMHQETSRT